MSDSSSTTRHVQFLARALREPASAPSVLMSYSCTTLDLSRFVIAKRVNRPPWPCDFCRWSLLTAVCTGVAVAVLEVMSAQDATTVVNGVPATGQSEVLNPAANTAVGGDQSCSGAEPRGESGEIRESGDHRAQSSVEGGGDDPRPSAQTAQDGDTGGATRSQPGAEAIGFFALEPQTAAQIGSQWPAATVEFAEQRRYADAIDGGGFVASEGQGGFHTPRSVNSQRPVSAWPGWVTRLSGMFKQPGIPPTWLPSPISSPPLPPGSRRQLADDRPGAGLAEAQRDRGRQSSAESKRVYIQYSP